MALPVNIDELIHGHSVEWERLEFKRGWNPLNVMHTICAFANDINNWGGGYVIIGIEEQNGRPVFPPAGLNPNQIDKIQGRLIEICHQIQPNYFPITQPEIINGKHVFIIWSQAGDNRPYTAPTTLGKRSERVPYIRLGSRTVIARGDNLRRLLEQTSRIPFDDRINQQASIDDFNLSLIQAYLKEVKSGLFDESRQIPFEQLCRQMSISRGANEYLRPINIGLLFFNDHPEIFFNRAQIDVIIHQDNSGTNFTEKIFKGPLDKQLRDALNFINTIVIREQVRKLENRPEAMRFYNYPYPAIEEALANAVYHKSYEEPSPIEVQVLPDRIDILSYPGPLPPIDEEALKKRRIVARRYRNRRIGDFLKELDLTEGRSTGFPKIYKSLEDNGSPPPVFKTDKDKTYFLTTIKIHPQFILTDQVSDRVEIPDEYLNINTIGDVNQILDYLISIKNDKVSDRVGDRAYDRAYDRVYDRAYDRVNDIVNDVVNDKVKKVLNLCIVPKDRKNLLHYINLKNHPDNYSKYIKSLIEADWLEMTIPDKPSSPKQRYRITAKGKVLLEILGNIRMNSEKDRLSNKKTY